MKKGQSMRRSYKKTGMAAVIAVAAISMAGCSGSADPAASDAGGSITFVTWVGGESGKKWENVAASFEEETGIKVEIEVLPSDSFDQVMASRMEAGNSPDLIQTTTEMQAPFIDAGLLTDLSDQEWVDSQIGAVKDFASYSDGKTYAFIPALDVAGVFYNVDTFDELGISVPETWDEFLEVVETVEASGLTPLAVGAKDGWPLVVQANQMATGALFDTGETEELRDGTITYSESKWTDVLADWSDLIAAGGYGDDVLGIDFASSASQFGTGETAMMIQGSFALAPIREVAPDMNMSMFVLPAGDQQVASVSYGSMVAVPAKAKNPDGVKKFLDYLSTPEVLTTFLEESSAFSAFEGVTPELEPALQAIAPFVAEKSAEYNLTPGTTLAVQEAMTTGVQGMLAGTATAEDVLAAMDRAK